MDYMGSDQIIVDAAGNVLAQGDEVLYPTYFVYQTPNIASLAAAGTTSNSIQLDTDAPFSLVKITAFADIGGAVQTADSRVLPLVTVQITPGGSNRKMFNAPVPLPTIMGDGSLPYVMPLVQRIAAGSTIQFDWVNFSNATTYANLRLQLHGYKTYLRG